jgi:hypothetical protein
MNKLYISESALSKMFWSALETSSDLARAKSECEQIVVLTKEIHHRFPKHIAGTISTESSISLWLISKFFGPRHVFEIGTFIGRSTLSLFGGGIETLDRFDTCDASFDQFYIPGRVSDLFSDVSKIKYWPKRSSASVLQELIDQGLRPDLLFIDGRLSGEDLKLFTNLDRHATVFVLDDFEGTEKGVINCINIRNLFPDMVLIRPRVLDNFKLMNIAILVSPRLIAFTRQQNLPLSMT